MRNRSKSVWLLLAITAFPVLTGCPQPRIIDDIRIVQALGFDYKNPKNVMATLAAPIFQKGGGGGEQSAKTDSYAVQARKGRQVKDLLNIESQHPLEFAKLMVALFDTRLAKSGIFEYVDLLNRDPEIGFNMHLAVVDGSVRELLKSQYPSNPLISVYLNDMIEQNTKRNLPTTNLQTFLYGYYAQGMDPFLPLLKKESDHVEIKGIALFRDDNYVGYLPYDDAFVFKMMNERFASGSYAAPWDSKHYVSIENIGSTVKYHVKNVSGDPNRSEVTIDVKQVGYMRTSSIGLRPKQYVTTLQQKMEKDLEHKGQKILRNLQKKRVDPLQIGDRVRSYTRNWDSHEWDDYYPHASIKLHVKVRIVQTGIIE